MTSKEGARFLGYIWTRDIITDIRERVSIYKHPKKGLLVDYLQGVGTTISGNPGCYHINQTCYEDIITGRHGRYKLEWHNIPKETMLRIRLRLAAEAL